MPRRALRLSVICLLVCGFCTSCVSHSQYQRAYNAWQGTEKALVKLKNYQAEIEVEREKLVTRIAELEAKLRGEKDFDAKKRELERLVKMFKGSATSTKGGEFVTSHDSKPAIRIPGEVLFSSGSDILTTGGKTALGDVVDFIKKNSGNFRIDGHTDSDPIKKSRWKNNMELSLHRGLSVFSFLVKQGIPASTLNVAGYGPCKPCDAGADAEAKRKNRRVEIVLLGTGKLPAGE